MDNDSAIDDLLGMYHSKNIQVSKKGLAMKDKSFLCIYWSLVLTRSTM